jgi:hypothetical protein
MDVEGFEANIMRGAGVRFVPAVHAAKKSSRLPIADLHICKISLQ